MIYKDYIINADPYLIPSYKLSPFSNSDISLNRTFSQSEYSSEYFVDRFIALHFNYTLNGREALQNALSNLSLSTNDTVSIITTSQNFYISSCVTKEIEKFCIWDRQIGSKTKVILVIHEFGFPYERLEELRQYNIPIIEDCAYSFNSQNKNNSVGTIGDFVIYSFPKFFPLQIGGLLVSKKEVKINTCLYEAHKIYICNIISHYLNSLDVFSQIRRENYKYLETRFKALGLKSRFGEIEFNTVPGVFMFELLENINGQELKLFFYANGVECSVFYGENSFFIPCHHNLSIEDMDYFVILMEFYLNNIK